MDTIRYDLYRLTGKTSTSALICTAVINPSFRKLWYYRILSVNRRNILVRFLNALLRGRVLVELVPSVKIGRGMLMLHPYCITFNSKAVIGENFTIMKGATIGNSKTGKVGAPIIGNNVYVGLNATVVGGVHIGNNVLIAPNAFVNFDVPDNSIVLGNPGQIHKKENASFPYIVNSITEITHESN